MLMGYKQGAKEAGVYFVIGVVFFILNMGVGAVMMLFADKIPFGDFGKILLFVVTVVINGFLVVLVASYQRRVKGVVGGLVQ